MYSSSFLQATFMKEQEQSRRALFCPLDESRLGQGLDLMLQKVYRLNYLKGLATIVKYTRRGLNVPLPKTVKFSAFTHIHRHLFSPAFIDHDLLFSLFLRFISSFFDCVPWCRYRTINPVDSFLIFFQVHRSDRDGEAERQE